MKFLVILFALVSFATTALAQGLMIHATEIGVGKFHRYDNHVHRYPANNVWAPHITPDDGGRILPLVFDNADHSVTIQFSSLEQLLQSVVAVSNAKHMRIAVLNINGHGMPGGMWYPKDEAQKGSFQCYSWNRSANAADKSNYDQYYSPVSKSEIMDMRKTAAHPAHYSCVTGAPEWTEVVGRIPNIKNYFTDDAQVHFESCLVGLGPVGEAFTKTVASLLFNGGHAMVKASTNFGLGDWSMPEGMGFWDYQSDAQLNRDNAAYPVNRKDRDLMQKGILRVTSFQGGQWISSLVADQDFMLVGFGFSNQGRVLIGVHTPMVESIDLPTVVHLPGTGALLDRMD